jgi:hypothetical protein
MDGVLVSGVADASAVIRPREEVDLKLILSFVIANAAKGIVWRLFLCKLRFIGIRPVLGIGPVRGSEK